MFEASSSQQPVANSVTWIGDTLLGEVAITLCVLAVAFVGFSMLTGHISIRRGGQVIIGCFILLGAPVIAASILGVMTPSQHSAHTPANIVVYEAQPREELELASNNPYTNATLRRRPPSPLAVQAWREWRL